MRASLGIDIGTSAAKVVALGIDRFEVLGTASRTYPTLTPQPGWVEQSPESWWQATVEAVKSLLDDNPGLSIEAVGLSGQVNGFVLLDAQNEPLGNAIIWLDSRSVEEAGRLDKDVGELLLTRAATQINAISIATKLAWLVRHDPDRLARAKMLLLVKDYILWRLTGEIATDASDASSTGLMEIETLDWLAPVCAAAGFSPAILPPIRPSTIVAGVVTAQASAMTGIAAGTPVVPGAGDIAALAVGCGLLSPGILGITLGTAGHVVLVQDAKKPFTPRPGLWRIAHADPEQSIWSTLVMSGGLSLSWLHRTMLSMKADIDFSGMIALALDSAPGANGVSFVPFLEGAATPYSVAQARGALTGLSSSTRAGDLVQATMEGVAFNTRQCVELLCDHGAEITEIRLAEGGARVDPWCQIIADVLQKPVKKLGFLDTSSLGAAMMAIAGVTGKSLEALSGDLPPAQEFYPDPGRALAFETSYRRYLASAESEIARAGSAGS